MLSNYKITTCMKNALQCILFLGFTILSWNHSYAQHSVSGDTESCYEDCKTYTLNGGIGGPYFWKTTGQIEGTNQGTEVTICWNTIGSNNIRLTDFSAPLALQTQQLDVQVSAIPSPAIIPPKYPYCTIRDSLSDPANGEFEVIECITACSESVSTRSLSQCARLG